MNDTNTVGPTDTPSKLGDVLMLPDTPVLAGVIMALAQPFAELRETVGLPPWSPLLIAALASLLIATYHVQFRRKARGPESWLLTPVVTLILFSGAVGANNVVDAARKGRAAHEEQASVTSRQFEQLRAELQLLNSELENERRLNQVLRTVVGTGVAPGSLGNVPNDESSIGIALHALVALLLPDARAQTEEMETPATPDPRVTEALRAYEQEQRRLQEERERMRQEQVQHPPVPTPPAEGTPLWKSW